MYLEEPEEILTNFLRSRITEITRTGESNRQTNTSQNFSGDDNTKIFTLTNTPVSIKTVTVGGVTQTPYLHYDIDLDNKKIRFVTAPGTGTNNITVNYYYGSTWIYPDSPRDDLARLSYPRIGVIKISESDIFKEIGSTALFNNITFQFDIVSFKNLKCTINSENHQGNEVTRYLSRRLINAFQDNFSTDLIYKCTDFIIINNYPIPFEEDKNIFRHIVEMLIQFRYLDSPP